MVDHHVADRGILRRRERADGEPDAVHRRRRETVDLFLPGRAAGTFRQRKTQGGGAGASRFEGASPNPARGATQLSFALAREAHVSLAIHDVHGRRVATLANGRFAAGSHSLQWEGLDDSGRAVATGLYFARFEGDGVRESRRVVRVR